ncbi:MAG: hypothetical protein ACYS6I_07900 [Planctomycetota bacterium]|jgi:anthranilate phosphoribosyltransferase
MAKITEYLEKLLEGSDLTSTEAGKLLDTVFEGEVADVQIAAFLAAMRAKGATADELAGLAGSLRKHAVRVEAGIDNLVDTCGTQYFNSCGICSGRGWCLCCQAWQSRHHE